MNPFQKIKNTLRSIVDQRNEEQRQRIERLAQLEASQKGFHISNPVQSLKDKKEIKQLKKEIAAFEKNKRNTSIIVGCFVFLISLICFCGVMAAFEDNASPVETTDSASVSMSTSTENTTSTSSNKDISSESLDAAESMIENVISALEITEIQTEETVSITETTEATMAGSTSPSVPTETLTTTVPSVQQDFQITWSAQLVDSNHVGNNWSISFEVDNEEFSSGSIVTVLPDTQFSVRLTIQENDSNPDTDYYFKRIAYSEELCTTSYTIAETLYVRENGGHYSGNCAEWEIAITITPIA